MPRQAKDRPSRNRPSSLLTRLVQRLGAIALLSARRLGPAALG
ncbi:hypothetical protein EDC22_101348 [Tepidamorphus gemmatus]|uniref:Uncharacterized protein n=1 Tax=Tepidamorphus gemmatus TaxID=747076 RepID=A0A4R3MI00_9HYPH|nr:hypothetical protein EDC22_101348 [Tepidamorphus gemmatus]